MPAMSDNAAVLRSRIKQDLDNLDIEALKQVYQTIAVIAAEKTIKLADRDWQEKGLSREKVKEEVKNYRQSKK